MGHRIRAVLRALLATALVMGLAVVGVTWTTEESAEAVQATGGSGRFTSIEWISWGAENAPITSGTSRTSSVNVGGKELRVTCTATRVDGQLRSYRSGDWQGDGLDQLYNVGGVDAANTMVVGMANVRPGATVTLDFSCTATLGGAPFPLAGLVIGDAESSSISEHVGATAPAGATWRIIDRVRGASCTQDTYAYRPASNPQRLELYGPAVPGCESGGPTMRPGASAVAFMEGGSSATQVTIRGGGTSAIALGYAIDVDFGDAPQSYGQAAAALQFTYSGGEVPTTAGAWTPVNRGVPVFGSITPATTAQPTVRLGRTVDPELTPPYSATAQGDDTSGTAASGGPDDEDAFTTPATPVALEPGGTYSITVPCVGPGVIGGWLDFDGNGAFDAGERSTATPTCAGGTSQLTWNVPDSLLTSGGTRSTFLRLRAVDPGEPMEPTGISGGGEVEDHALSIVTPPRLTVVKQVGTRIAASDQFTVSATGTGLNPALSTTTSGAAISATSVQRVVRTGQTYTITDAMAAGSSNAIGDYRASLQCVDRASGNAAVATGGSGPSWTVGDLTNGQDVLCTVTNTAAPSDVDVVKTPGTATGPSASGGYTATYRIEVRNSGRLPGTYTLTDTPAFPANTEVTGLTWTTSGAGAPAGGSRTGPGPFQLSPTDHTVARGQTHRYDVTVSFRYRDTTTAATCAAGGGLVNRAALGPGQEQGPTANNAACVDPPAAPVQRLVLDKQVDPVVDLDGNGVDAGDRLDFRFVVRNEGTVTISSTSVVDPRVTGVTCPATTIAPSATLTCTASLTVTQTDLDAGTVENTARVSGTAPNGATVQSNLDSTSTPLPRPAALLIDKTAGPVADANSSGRVDAGDRITYAFTVTNTGRVTLTQVGVTDPRLPGVTCSTTTLAPGASTTCTAPAYTITQADIDAGAVQNQATSTAKHPDGSPVGSPPDTTSTPLPSPSTLTLVKSAGAPVDVNGSGLTDAGDTIAYSFAVTNTGGTTLTSVGVDDPKLAGISITCAATTLAPGGSTTCTPARPYVVTEADETAKEVANTATATGTPPSGPPVTATSSTRTPTATPAPGLVLDKSVSAVADVNGSGLTDAGDTVTYGFTVTNTGNVPVSGVRVDDPRLPQVTCSPTTLAPGGVATCTAQPYTVTEADEQAGSAANVATAHGTDPDGGSVASPPDRTSTPVTTPRPGLTVVKDAAVDDTDASGQTDAGDRITYTFTVTNSGNVPLSSVVLDDPLLAAAGITTDCGPEPLALGASRSCTASGPYVVTADDASAGSVVNTVTATGTDPDGDPVRSDPDTVTTPTAPAAPALQVVKTAGTPVDVNGSGLTDAGDTIAYTFDVTNTGNVTVRSLAVVDAKLTGQPGLQIVCDATSLAAGATTQCRTAPGTPYVVTSDDVAAGRVDNVATTTATTPGGGTVTSPPSDTSTPVTAPRPALAIDKRVASQDDVNGNGLVDAGDRVTYAFTVTNTGNVPVTGVVVDDPRLDGESCTATRLEPGESTTCTAAPSVVTADDVAAGSVVNTATARGTDPDGGGVTSPPDTTSVPATRPQPGLVIDKTVSTPVDVNASGITDAGDTVTYAFRVTNSGNVPVGGVAIDDPLLSGLAVTCTSGCGDTLGVGQVRTFTSEPYRVTAADVAAGAVANSATAVGTDPDGDPVDSPPGTTTTSTTQPQPGLAIAKQVVGGAAVDVNGSGLTDAGDTIAYTFTVTNTGNVPLDEVVVRDDRLAAAGIGVTCDPASGPLAVGDERTCTADAPYVVTATDEQSGSVDNTATASATDPDGGPVPSGPDTVSVPTTVPAPALLVDKVAGAPVDVNGSGLTDAGDTIAYTFTVTNTGNVPVDAIRIDDPVLTAGVTCEATSLAPGSSTTCTAAPHTITEAQQQGGSVANRAVAVGTDPDRETVTSPPDDTSTPVRTPAPQLTIVKSVDGVTDVNASGLTDAGDEIVYAFSVTNSGNVTVRDVGVADARLSGQDPVVTVTCEATTLAAGERTDCTVSGPYVVTEADEQAGSVANTATATGVTVGGPLESDPDTTTTPTAVPHPALTLVKTAAVDDVDGDGQVGVDDVVTYTITLVNAGNVPLADVVATDPMFPDLTCPTTLAVGAEKACDPVQRVVTQEDVDRGELVNVATAVADDPDGDPVPPATDDVTVVMTVIPALAIDKQASPARDVDGDGVVAAGDEVDFTFVVTNTGTIPLDQVTVDDPTVGAVTCPVATLEPGESMTCVVEGHVIGQAAVEAGQLVNVATARAVGGAGTPVAGQPVDSGPDSTTTPLDQRQAMTLTKSAALQDSDGDQLADAGERIVYTLLVTNTGTVQLTDVRVDDPLLAERGVALDCAVPELLPGATTTCTATLEVTDRDVAAGTLRNVATATASGGGGDVTVTDDVTSPLDPPDGGLPMTGAGGLGWLLLGLLLVVLGAVMTDRARRSSSRKDS